MSQRNNLHRASKPITPKLDVYIVYRRISTMQIPLLIMENFESIDYQVFPSDAATVSA